MPRKGGKRKKTRTHQVVGDEDNKKKTPKCFVVRRGHANGKISDLVRDFRQVMAPNTAQKLREKKTNKIKDFVNIAGPLNVSHLFAMHATESASYVKLGTLPQGPTLSFRLSEFTLSADVKATQKRPRQDQTDFRDAPLLVMNGFGQKDQQRSKELALAASSIKQAFAPIDVRDHNIGTTRRVALFNYDKEKDMIEFRHYAIKRSEAGLSRGIRKLLKNKKNLDLSRSKNVADYITTGGYASDSEMEDNVPVPGVKDKMDRNVAISLQELGPRMKLNLVKVEEGMMAGKVLWEKRIVPGEEELKLKGERKELREELKKKINKEKREKKARKRELRENKEENLRKKRKLEGISDEEEEEKDVIPSEGRRQAYHPFRHKKDKVTEAGPEKVIEFGSDDDTPIQAQQEKKYRKKKPSMGGRQRKKTSKA